MKRLINAKLIICLLFSSGSSFASDQISARQASAFIGETATVCGVVASATYSKRSNGQPTFLNLDKAYPNHIFTAVIFGDYRRNFDYAPESLEGEDICVSGRIDQYNGKPQIKIRSPSQIEIN